MSPLFVVHQSGGVAAALHVRPCHGPVILSRGDGE